MKLINLYEYQQKYYEETLLALKSNKGTLLAMDTGMGKTYVATRIIQDSIIHCPKIKILVLVRKKNLDDPWGLLFGKGGALMDDSGKPYYYIYNRQSSNKLKPNAESIADFSDYNVILTNYEVFERNIDDFRFINWDLIIYDEIHDRDSKTKEQIVFKTLSNLNVKKQIGLTASPMRNTMKELYILHKFLQDNKSIHIVYKALEKYEKKFIKETSTSIKKDSKEQTKQNNTHLLMSDDFEEEEKKSEYEGPCAGDRRIMASLMFEKALADKLRKRMGKNIFYHSKRDKDVPSLPPLVTRNIFLPLHDSQSFGAYVSLEGKNYLKLWENGAILTETSPMAAYSAGKIVDCNIPYQPNTGISTKEVFTVELVKHIIETTDDKIIIFSQLTRILSYFLKKLNKFGCAFIEGKTKDYLERIEKFGKDKNKRIILVSIEAYKEGIDLRCANHVIFLDLPYNPQVLLQAKDRCHRTGQKKNVFVYYLFYKSDFPYAPDNIRRRCLTRKHKLFEYLFGVDSDGNRLPEFIIENYELSYNMNQKEDIEQKYVSLKNILQFLFASENFTEQFEAYNTDFSETKSYSKYGISIAYTRMHGFNKDQLIPSVFDDIDFSEGSKLIGA